jgi:hypothetical protein
LIPLPDVFFQFLGELADLDAYRAGPFAGPAIGAAAGQVKGPEKMEGPQIGFVQALADPLGLGFIAEA